MQLKNSPVTSFMFNNHLFYVKRDDLLDLQFNGNKARKLAFYLEHDFPHIDTLISYGGDQSNLMYSLSALAKLKNWHFKYYTRKLSALAKASQNGNLSASLKNNMKLYEVEKDFKQFCQNLPQKQTANELLITQGGYGADAEYGLQILAQEIRNWAQSHALDKLNIFVASGTGTSAFYLQQHLPEFKIYTSNCVGSPDYLTQQFTNLSKSPTDKLPLILTNSRFKFASPEPLLWQTWQQICFTSSIEFDLVYDPVGWHILLENLDQLIGPILYLHCGGTQGNITMLGRYNYLQQTTKT